LEGRASKRRFQKASEEEIPINKKKKIKDISRATFRLFPETSYCGKKRIISGSRVASSRASSIASERTESIICSSKKLTEKWNNLSPGDSKIISESIVAMIEIWLLNSTETKSNIFCSCQAYIGIRLRAEKTWRSL
jgi:hypothetical protein